MSAFFVSLLMCVSAQQAQPIRTSASAALMDLKPMGLGAQEAEILSDRLRWELSAIRGAQVLDRSSMDRVVHGKFESCFDPNCARQAGAALGVDEMIVGTVAKIGDQFTFTLHLVDTRTNQPTRTIIQDFPARIEDVASKGLPFLAAKIAGIQPANATIELPPVVQAAPAPRAAPGLPATPDYSVQPYGSQTDLGPDTRYVDIDGHTYTGNLASLRQPGNKQTLEDKVSDYYSAKHRAFIFNIIGAALSAGGSVLVQNDKDDLQAGGVMAFAAGGVLEVFGVVSIIQTIARGAHLAGYENELGVHNVDVDLSLAPVVDPGLHSTGLVASLRF